jgi:Tfp pilus assembly protein PilN
MINLLPQKQKRELSEKKDLKIALILGILLLSFLLSFTLILLTIKVFISRDLEVEEVFLAEKEGIISLNQQIEEDLEETNLSFSNLNSFYKGKGNLILLLEKISAILPAGTYLEGFNYNPIESGGEIKSNISISGFCLNRDTLLTFKKNLEKENGFFDINFPPENWIEPTNIKFNISFTFQNP